MENSQQNNQELVSIVAEIWQDRKRELSAATIAEAEEIAAAEIEA